MRATQPLRTSRPGNRSCAAIGAGAGAPVSSAGGSCAAASAVEACCNTSKQDARRWPTHPGKYRLCLLHPDTLRASSDLVTDQKGDAMTLSQPVELTTGAVSDDVGRRATEAVHHLHRVFGRTVRRLRTLHRIPLADLAASLSMSQADLHAVEAGLTAVTPQVRAKLGLIFGQPL